MRKLIASVLTIAAGVGLLAAAPAEAKKTNPPLKSYAGAALGSVKGVVHIDAGTGGGGKYTVSASQFGGAQDNVLYKVQIAQRKGDKVVITTICGGTGNQLEANCAARVMRIKNLQKQPPEWMQIVDSAGHEVGTGPMFVWAN